MKKLRSSQVLWLATVVAAVLSGRRAAAANACPTGGELRTYYKAGPYATTGGDSRCDMYSPVPGVHICTIELKGYLFIPSTPLKASGWPFILYNHGSEELPGPKCDIGEEFASRGYVVFVPHRRGHGLSLIHI